MVQISDVPPRAGRRRAALTTLALLVVGLAGPLAYALGQPAYSTGDEMPHVDYAYQIWMGQLPSFFDGLALQTDVGYRPGLQWVSQHPPLFYALLAPIVGPLVEAGHPVVAVMAARGALILLAGASVLGVRWMVRGAFPARPEVATAAALIYALSSWFPRQGGSIYNDLPAVLAITLATGFVFRLMRSPDSRGLLAGFAASLAVASLIRFSTLTLAAGLVAALLVHRFLVVRRGRRGVVEALVAVAAVLVASGWWWVRQRSITGNFAGSRAEFWIEDRGWSPRSLTEVVTSDFWLPMLQQFFSTTFVRPVEPWVTPAWVGIVGLLLVPLGLGLVSLVGDRVRAPRDRENATQVIVLLTLVGLIGTVVATQIAYSMSSGSSLPRYFFALIPSAAAVMAYGFWRHRWTVVLFGVWIAVRLGTLALELDSTIDRPLRGPQADIYPHLVWSAYATIVVATVVVTWSLVADLGAARRARRAVAPEPQAVH